MDKHNCDQQNDHTESVRNGFCLNVKVSYIYLCKTTFEIILKKHSVHLIEIQKL